MSPLPVSDQYQLPVRFPAVYGRGYAQSTTQRVELRGALVAPTAASSLYVLKSSTGETVLEKSVTIVDDVATVSIGATDLDDLPFGKSYTERWQLVVGARTLSAQRRVAISSTPLEMPAGGLDTDGVDQDLVRNLGNHLQPYLEEAWGDVLRHLWRLDVWPDAVVDTHELHEPLRELARAKVRRDLSTQADDRHWRLYEEHKQNAAAALNGLRFRRDENQDGIADTESPTAAMGVLHLNGAPGRRIPGWA